MNKKTSLILGATFVLAFLMLVGCKNSAQKDWEREHALDEIQTELSKLESALPYKLPATDIWMTALELEDSMLTCVCELSGEDWDIYSMPEKEANSDRNIARIISGFDPEVTNLLERGDLGFKYVYVDKETKQTFMSISVAPQRFKDIKAKLDDGEISPYSILELFEMDINQYDIPCMIDDGMWLTDAYIKGNCAYYEMTIEEELGPSDYDYEIMKEGIIENLQKTPMIIMSKDEMGKRTDKSCLYIQRQQWKRSHKNTNYPNRHLSITNRLREQPAP